MGDVRMVRNSWHLDGFDDPPDDSVVGTPPRRPMSIRRTMHVNVSWRDRFGGPAELRGRARDLVMAGDGAPTVRATDEVRVDVDPSQTITGIAARPERHGLAALAGDNAIRGFRAAVSAALPDDRAALTPLSFLLDDIPVVSMISGIAWAQHRSFDIPISKDDLSFQRMPARRIACSGLRPGGYQEQSLERGITFPHWVRPAGDLTTDDEWAWHEIDPAPPVCFRRRRRIDAWRPGEGIEVDAHFRDSMWGPQGDELALHEYTLAATINDADVLTSLAVQSRVLPFPECPSAVAHAQALVGSDVSGLRRQVGEVLTELHACTHLNDMLRGLADVPALVRSTR